MASTAFAELDALTGGFQSGGQYLVHGPASTGKSTFGLGFLHAGLSAGETGLLITDRPPRQVLLQARAFGYELEDAVRDGRLILFEYPENVSQNLASLIDDGRVARELRAMIGERMVQRVVFDPVTPLLAGAHRESSAERVKALARSLAGQATTALFIVGVPDGAGYVSAARESIASALRFEPASSPGGPRVVHLEGFAGHEGASVQFELVQGKGFQKPAAASHEFLDPDPTPRPPAGNRTRLLPAPPRPSESRGHEWDGGMSRILILEPDRNKRSWLDSVLGGEHRLIHAQNAADGLALAASEEPDAIIVDQNLKGVTASEMIRRLRNSGRMQPVITIGDRLARTSDRIDALLAGTDACFAMPTDARVLRMNVSTLLSWPKRSRMCRSAAANSFRSPQRDPVSYTSDSDYFLRRCEYEADWAADLAVPFCVVSMKPPLSASPEELASTTALLTRSIDLTLAAPRGLLILLAEAATEEPYLGRFRCRWSGGYSPAIEVLRFDRQPGFAGLVKSMIATISGAPGAALAQTPSLSGLGAKQ